MRHTRIRRGTDVIVSRFESKVFEPGSYETFSAIGVWRSSRCIVLAGPNGAPKYVPTSSFIIHQQFPKATAQCSTKRQVLLIAPEKICKADCKIVCVLECTHRR